MTYENTYRDDIHKAALIYKIIVKCPIRIEIILLYHVLCSFCIFIIFILLI